MEFLQILISFIIFRYKKKGLEGYMNRLSLVLISSIALMFAACGDDGGSATRPSEESSSSVALSSSSSSVIPSSSSSKVTEPAEVTKGSITDTRDGQTYKTVTIGTQTWMAENLNYKTDNSYCYNDNASNCTKYGRLYTWAAAITACPTGWHLPTKAEFETLFTAVGGQSTAGKMLKSTSGWKKSGNSTDDYSFSALPAGYRLDDGDYGMGGYNAYFWSFTEYNSNRAYRMDLDYGDDEATLYYYDEVNGFSVRCVKD